MELYEHIVLAYLTKDPWVFVCPQYSIRGEKGEWSCPDIVALDFKHRLVLVVEISTAYDPKSLREKVASREVHWIEKLQDQLVTNGVIDQGWNFEVHLYVRQSALHGIEAASANPGTPVKIKILEQLGTPWEWARG
jgi:hypothetical protein